MAYLNGKKVMNAVVEEVTILGLVDQEYNPQSANAQSGKAVAEAIGKNNIEIDNAINNGNAYAINTAKGYTDEKVGNIETALDNIIAIQNSLIGGDA